MCAQIVSCKKAWRNICNKVPSIELTHYEIGFSGSKWPHAKGCGQQPTVFYYCGLLAAGHDIEGIHPRYLRFYGRWLHSYCVNDKQRDWIHEELWYTDYYPWRDNPDY